MGDVRNEPENDTGPAPQVSLHEHRPNAENDTDLARKDRQTCDLGVTSSLTKTAGTEPTSDRRKDESDVSDVVMTYADVSTREISAECDSSLHVAKTPNDNM